MVLVWQIVEDSENCQTPPLPNISVIQYCPCSGGTHLHIKMITMTMTMTMASPAMPITIGNYSNSALRYYSLVYTVIQYAHCITHVLLDNHTQQKWMF